MLWREHNPPHFHAKYGEYEITVDINKQIVSGKFPRRASIIQLTTNKKRIRLLA